MTATQIQKINDATEYTEVEIGDLVVCVYDEEYVSIVSCVDFFEHTSDSKQDAIEFLSRLSTHNVN